MTQYWRFYEFYVGIIFVFAIFKGWFGERGAQLGMWLGLNSAIYPRIHDLVIPAPGGSTQIDHVVVSVFGIFVIETKNMNGWIFGDERSPKWTQCLYGKKYSFQNPLHQNYRHTKALADLLDLPGEVFHSVVFFIGECELKSALPRNVMTQGICRYIQSFREQHLTDETAKRALQQLNTQKAQPSTSRKIHIAGLKQRHSGDTCPSCGEKLMLRTAKQGANKGRQFYGCSAFPKCCYLRSI